MPRFLLTLPSENEMVRLVSDAGWRVGSLARKLGLSSRQLERRFLADYSLSPHQWIDKQRRLIVSRELGERKQMKWMAGDVGFASSAHFSRWFKIHMKPTSSIVS